MRTGNGNHYFLKMNMCGFCLAENFKYNSEEETMLLVKYRSSSGASDLHSKVPI